MRMKDGCRGGIYILSEVIDEDKDRMKNVKGCSLFLLRSYSCFSCVLGVRLIIGVDENTMLIEMVTAGKYTRGWQG